MYVHCILADCFFVYLYHKTEGPCLILLSEFFIDCNAKSWSYVDSAAGMQVPPDYPPILGQYCLWLYDWENPVS